jgi:hypothetical protein
MLVLLPLAVLLFASPGRTRRLLAFAAGFAALFLPLLAVNRWLYGGPFRTGYHFYCPALWDYPGPGFELRHAFVTSGRFDGTAGPGNFYRYLRDLIGAPPSPPLLPMPVVALALYGCWRLARAGHRAFAATLIAFAAVLVGFHSMFLYYVERYLLPLVPLTAVAAAAGAVALLRRGRVAATVAAGALGLSAFLAWPGAWAGVNRREGAVVEPGFLAAAARRLEPDAVIVTGLPGPLVQHYLIRGTRRRFVPLVDAHLVYWPEPVPGRPPVPAGADSEDVMRAYWSWSAGRGRREVFLPGADHLLADLELHVVGSLPTYFEDASRRTQPAAWEAVARRFRLEPVERAGADTLYRLHVRPR